MGLRIVIATIGSLGDLHPFVAVAMALQARGHEPILAVPADHLAKCTAAGLRAEAMVPSYRDLAARLGLGDTEAVRGVMHSPDFLVRHILLPTLQESAAAVHAISADADAVFVSQFALGGALAAEARRLPLINAVLQPMSLLSAFEPPRTPDFAMMVGSPAGGLALAWNQFVIGLIGAETRRRYGPAVNAVRRSFGLSAGKAVPLFAHEVAPHLNLALYSGHFAPAPPDAPANTKTVGFPRFDSDSGQPEALAPDLERFLAEGQAPLVFTLGSFAVYAAGDFYGESLKAARALGMRSVLLIGPEGARPNGLGPDVHVAAYAPHSQLFPRAAAVIHHGGIGTTGQALYGGRPQLVVPHMGDQPDNGARIVKLGVGAVIAAKRYHRDAAAQVLAQLLDAPAVTQRAAVMASALAAENGAAQAAEAIEVALG